jgi:mRNA interferase RelE/StbE
MKTAFVKSFQRDLKALKIDHQIRRRIQKKIEEVEAASGLDELSSLKKLTGGENYYRIRVGDYRIGIVVEEDTVVFVRCLHRREIYRYFP